MDFPLDPLRVECKSCRVSAETYDYQHPDLAVTCPCCPLDHDHTGLGCRPVTIYATARMALFDIGDLMEIAAEQEAAPRPAEIPAT